MFKLNLLHQSPVFTHLLTRVPVELYEALFDFAELNQSVGANSIRRSFRCNMMVDDQRYRGKEMDYH